MSHLLFVRLFSYCNKAESRINLQNFKFKYIFSCCRTCISAYVELLVVLLSSQAQVVLVCVRHVAAHSVQFVGVSNAAGYFWCHKIMYDWQWSFKKTAKNVVWYVFLTNYYYIILLLYIHLKVSHSFLE